MSNTTSRLQFGDNGNEAGYDTSSLVFWLSLFRSAFSVLPISLHLIGILLLCKPNTFQKNQKIYLIHLSVLEVLFMLSQSVALYINLYRVNPVVYEYVSLFILCVFAIPWCNFRIALAHDRYMEIKLNIKYIVNMNQKVRRIAYCTSWITGIALFVIMALLRVILKIDSARIVLVYLMSVYHGFVVLLCVLVYTYIFKVIRRNRRTDWEQLSSGEIIRQQNQKRRIYIPFCIVANYFVFVIVPDIVFKTVFIKLKQDRGRSAFFPTMMFLFDCCGFADAVIYIFLNKSTRKRFMKILHII